MELAATDLDHVVGQVMDDVFGQATTAFATFWFQTHAFVLVIAGCFVAAAVIESVITRISSREFHWYQESRRGHRRSSQYRYSRQPPYRHRQIHTNGNHQPLHRGAQ